MNGRNFFLVVAAVIGCVLPACKTAKPRDVIVLSTARLAADFESYRFERVGVMPLEGDLDDESARALQADLFAELSRSTPYELVTLSAADLAEVRRWDPMRTGGHVPEALVEISQRFRLDAVLFSQVPLRRIYPPLEISLAAELVASETGQVVWNAAVHLDANDERVRHGLEGYFAREHRAESGGAGWQLALLSPTRFARFAAFQIALQL